MFDQVKLWRADSIVLLDWLMTVELDKLPMTNRAQRQALSDLLSALEVGADVPGVSAEEIASAQAQVCRDYGWLARLDDGPFTGQIQTVELNSLGAPPAMLILPGSESQNQAGFSTVYACDERTDHVDGFHYRVVDVG